MYLLKYLENSDYACTSEITAFTSHEECYAKMRGDFQQMKRMLGILKEDIPLAEDDSESGLYSAYLDADNAYLRKDIDRYSWEILVDTDLLPSGRLYTVSGVYHDLENGVVYHSGPVLCRGEDKAKETLRRMFEEQLQAYGLEENGSSDEEGTAIPGGGLFGEEATIYANAAYAFDCLVEVASFIMKAAEFADAK